MNLENVTSIYFIGIGGIAMSAAAGLAKEAGYEVSGSDSKELYAPAKDVLDKYKIEYHVGYDLNNIVKNPADLYIASAGEDSRNPEISYLEEQDIPFYSFAELLGELAKEKIRIVVAGTNGKSTTTGMLGHILSDIDDSSFMTGAVLQQYDSNFHAGDGNYFIFEGDEYKSLYNDPSPKFHHYKADALILTNLEFDHPDLYSSLEEIKDEFRILLANMPDDGVVIWNADDANLAQLMHETTLTNFSYGINNPADYKVEDITFGQELTTFTLNRKSKNEADIYSIALAGKLNIYNALGPICLLRAFGFAALQIEPLVKTYFGVKRRLELVDEVKNIRIFDDYAHFPTAIRETLAALKTRYKNNRIIAVFEPHTYSRTAATVDELATSFADATKVLIAEIYPARESKSAATITGQAVVEAISEHHSDVQLVADKKIALEILKTELQPGDIVIIMAVGSFNTLAYDLKTTL